MLKTWLQRIKNIFLVAPPTMDKTFSLSPSRGLYNVKLARQLKQEQAQRPVTPLPNERTEIEALLTETFYARRNPDFTYRSFDFPWGNLFIAFYDSLIDAKMVQESVINPLLNSSPVDTNVEITTLLGLLTDCHVVQKVDTVESLVQSITKGYLFIFLDGYSQGLVLEVAADKGRAVETTQTESVVTGPYEGFVENVQKNLFLLRRRLASSDLIAEKLPAGRRERGPMYLLYFKGITNPKLVREMRRRLKSLDVDALHNLYRVEQYIQDNPRSLFSQMTLTERPDRTAAFLLEGSVAVLMEGSPLALIAPVTFWAQLHSPEDSYFRWPVASFVRIIRVFGMIVTIFLPGLYVAFVNFHPEMIPTELLMSIASSRERIPLPAALSLLFLEIAFEFIREAAQRVPKSIGPTIGIVGAIIIGQAVVEAGVVSPLSIIVMAMTALAGFSLPQFQLTYTLRIIRLGMLAAGSIFGIYGILLAMIILICHLVRIRSFGIPLLSPSSPLFAKEEDVLWRPPPFYDEKRPPLLRPLNQKNQATVTRPWSPQTPIELSLLQKEQFHKRKG
ncbi:spore germination protein [Heliobacillus mobilis]|uniref:Spore germination protein n=1 Tax=Heliobacterium mobile TaxID=28064 RepID=A0A6I3SKI5_HELMO|nr:spore germination protein [Heliobacterium mobile]MTV49265.1 spore germination protein [Heliobacterium mobile]